MIAALYVATDGAYYGLPDVDPWDATRDARLYAGLHPVVAHPPCERWGRYWHGGPAAPHWRQEPERAPCGRRLGMLEHAAPATDGGQRGGETSAVVALRQPLARRRWSAAGDGRGWTCCVEQGHYGHRARKATWLYAAGVSSLPSLRWGPSAARVKLDLGYHTAEERERFRRPPTGVTFAERAARRAWLEERERQTGKVWCCPERMHKRERAATPEPFRDVLLGIARSVRRGAEVAA